MSGAEQPTLGQQIWRMAEQMALPLMRPGVVSRHPTLVALDAAPRLERRYETLAAPGLLSAQIAQRFAAQDTPASGAELPLSMPQRPASTPAVARWSAQRWPEAAPAAPAASATSVVALRRSAAAPVRQAAEAPSALVARSADLTDVGAAEPDLPPGEDQPQQSAPQVDTAEMLPDVAPPSATPAAAPAVISRTEADSPPAPAPQQSAVLPSDAAPPAPTAARAVDPAPISRTPEVVPPAAPLAAPQIARAADVGEVNPAGGAPAPVADQEPSGGVAAVDLALVQPAALRPTTLMRSLPPDPLARMGLTTGAPPLAPMGETPAPQAGAPAAELPVARTPMRAAAQPSVAVPAPVAPQAPTLPTTPPTDAPRALPMPGTVRRVPARRTTIARSAEPPPAAEGGPIGAGAAPQGPLQDAELAQDPGDLVGASPVEPSDAGEVVHPIGEADEASPRSDPAEPADAAPDAALTLQRTADSPPAAAEHAGAALPPVDAPGMPEAAVHNDAPPGGEGRGVWRVEQPMIARQYADLPLAARSSDVTAADDAPDEGAPAPAGVTALPAVLPLPLTPLAARSTEGSTDPTTQQGASPAARGALAALPLQRSATPILRHAAAPLAGVRSGSAPTLHDPSWRPASAPALGVAERLADTPSGAAQLARTADIAPGMLAGPPAGDTPHLPLTAGWRSADLPDTSEQSVGRVERSAAADLGGVSDTPFPGVVSMPGQAIGGAPLPLVPTIAAQIRRMQAESPAVSRAFGIPGSGMLDKIGDVRDRVSDAASDLPGQLPDPSAPLELVRGPAAEASRLMNAARDAAGGAESLAQSAGQALSGGAAAPGGAAGAGQPTIEQIARQVYDHLRRQLLIDRERLGRM